MYSWNILDDMFSMRDLMEKAFGELSGGLSGGTPAINVYESETASEVKALVPGFSRDDLEINFEKGLLTISSREQKDAPKPDGKIVREECCRAQFRRSIRFTKEIDRDAISARLENGVLTVTLPHQAESTPKKIEVQ